MEPAPDPLSPESARIDRTAVSSASLGDETDDVRYWHERTPAERFHALELMRRIAYGEDACTARLQGFLEFAELASGRVIARRWVDRRQTVIPEDR